MNGTPDSYRLHIVIAGERNSGKSSLLNAIAGQQVAIVSDIPGTTTDHVSKAMELPGPGACVLIDTAGIDDCGELGAKRIEKTLDSIHSADIILAVADASTGRVPGVRAGSVPVVPVINKCDLGDNQSIKAFADRLAARFGRTPVAVNALSGEGIDDLIGTIQEIAADSAESRPLTESVVKAGGLALLVMPQDSQAPKGRLILPQQQVIRELLDRGCRILCCTTGSLASSLNALKEAPDVIITDSKDIAAVSRLVPEGSGLTSFSILLAASKGDLDYFMESARRIDALTEKSRVLIAEACTHVPASEDIGRVRIPRLLRSKAGEGLHIDNVSGKDFPEDLRGYDLVIHCGACMFNRRYMMGRVEQARTQGVPMTNYGITIAHINNILQYENRIIARSGKDQG